MNKDTYKLFLFNYTVSNKVLLPNSTGKYLQYSKIVVELKGLVSLFPAIECL